jgi:hypothetical protein
VYWEQLTTKLLTAKDSLPSFSDYPSKIYPPSETTAGGFLGFGKENRFWGEVEKLRKFTDSGSQNFSDQYRGSTGWEYEMMMAFVYKKFFYSRAHTSKEYTMVRSSHSLKIEPAQAGSAWEDNILIDGQAAGYLRYVSDQEKKERNEAIEKDDFLAGFVCHFHSHPRIKKDVENNAYYHFFSPQDIYSLIQGRTPMMGLVTDRLWVLGKTEEFMRMVGSNTMLASLGNDLELVSRAEMKGHEEMESAAMEFLQKYALAGYVADFGRNLYRVGY